MADTEEMGLFVDAWPQESIEICAFQGCTDPMLVGITEVNECQKYINNNLREEDPAQGLPAAREAAHVASAHAKAEELEAIKARAPKKANGEKDNEMLKSGVPASSFYNDTLGDKRLTAAGASTTPRKSPKKKAVPKARQDPSLVLTTPDVPATPASDEKPKPKRKPRQRLSNGDTSLELSADSPLQRTSILGTTSAKYSYLISRILELHETDKILIFYNGDHIAWYLSQALDLFAIKHLIYASKLAGAARSKYIVLFDQDPSHRVLLMDVRQASHGLNVSSASRVFFVNPVFNPATEAQAIKRAHRIGQTKPVYVETLVLKGTIEEAMLERSRAMTRMEHAKASKSLTDDYGMARIIMEARCLEISEKELDLRNQMASLNVPQQIFGRSRVKAEETGLEKELFGGDGGKKGDGGDGEDQPSAAPKKKRRKPAAMEGDVDSDGVSTPKPKRARAGRGKRAAVQSQSGTATPAESSSVFTAPQTTIPSTLQHDASTSTPSTTAAPTINGYSSIFGGISSFES